ncbi:hypothetical protein [Tateyamaria sp.]|uniref:hypothetical protein n=1 Tax=Tateyamaria sp. TaxID=1929288 RepID=UPI00329AE308
MKYLTQAAVAVSLLASPLAAQETSQAAVVGNSGDAVYSLQVTGANGATYNCLPNTQNVNGQVVRRCQRIGASGGQILQGSLVAPAAGAIAALAVLVLVGTGGSSSTTTTN